MSTMVRWTAVVIALVGGLALGGSRASAQQIPGDVKPLPAIVTVWDCPYEGADLSTECETVVGVPVNVVADGVPVEGSGALTAEVTPGFAGITVLLPAIGAEVTASAPGVTVTVLTPDLVLSGCENGATCAFISLVRVVEAPSTETTFVNVVVADCPYAEADVSDLCDEVEGAVVHVAVDGVEVAGSPAATAPNGIGGRTAGFRVPTGATLTVWSEPVGDAFVPAAGYDPLTIAPESFYIGNCGGEASCPYVFLIKVPAGGLTGGESSEPGVVPGSDVDDAASDGGAVVGGEAVTRLPNTGTGPDRSPRGVTPLVLTAALAALAGLTRRRRSIR